MCNISTTGTVDASHAFCSALFFSDSFDGLVKPQPSHIELFEHLLLGFGRIGWGLPIAMSFASRTKLWLGAWNAISPPAGFAMACFVWLCKYRSRAAIHPCICVQQLSVLCIYGRLLTGLERWSCSQPGPIVPVTGAFAPVEVRGDKGEHLAIYHITGRLF